MRKSVTLGKKKEKEKKPFSNLAGRTSYCSPYSELSCISDHLVDFVQPVKYRQRARLILSVDFLF